MNETQILSGFQESLYEAPPPALPPAHIFDACQVGVVLRAVLLVELVLVVLVLVLLESSLLLIQCSSPCRNSFNLLCFRYQLYLLLMNKKILHVDGNAAC